MKDGRSKILNKLSILGNIPYWVFVILFVASAVLSISALRSNNQTMIELRNKVYEADKNGSDVESALDELRLYVHSHMNTNLSSGGNAIKPPIQLKYTYERLQASEQQRVDSANEEVYTEAQRYCERQNPAAFSGRTRVPCIEEYVTTHGEKPDAIPASLYQFDFVSPTWSPDLAGWSLILSGILLMASVTSFLVDRLVKAKLKPL